MNHDDTVTAAQPYGLGAPGGMPENRPPVDAAPTPPDSALDPPGEVNLTKPTKPIGQTTSSKRLWRGGDGQAEGAGCPMVTIVVPTRNEAPNVAPLVSRIATALAAGPNRPRTTWEVIFVDDSDDDTPHAVREVGAEAPVHLLHRPPGARYEGLGGAVLEGFAEARGTVLVVMDADLQHPPELLPHLIRPILDDQADLVSGTRYVSTGVTAGAGLAGPWRRTVSSGSRRLVHLLVPRSRCLSDPMSGLFAISRQVLDGVELRPNGFKILLEVAARAHVRRVHNVGYRFAPRNAGTSKASLKEGVRFLRHLLGLVRVRSQLRRLPPVQYTESAPVSAKSEDGSAVQAIA